MVSTIVALDLGTTHIRGVEAEIKNGKRPKIKKIHSVAIDEEIVSVGEIVNVEGLTKAIKKLWDEAKFKSKYVITMAGGEAIENRILNTPWSPDEDYKRLLPHYIKEDSILADKEDEYYFDAHTLNEYFETTDENNMSMASNKRMKEVIVAAVKKTFIENFVKAIEANGLRPYGVDVLPLALIRSQAYNSDIPENASVVSIEIGGEMTTIVIHKNHQPAYITNAPAIGGLRVTNEIANSLAITTAAAELLKISFSVPPEQRDQLKTYNYFDNGTRPEEVNYNSFSQAQKEQAVVIVSREVSNIISYITEILDDAYSNSNDTPFRILLSGGGVGLHTLLARVQSELGVPTEIVQPFNNVDVSALTEDQVANQHIYTSLFGLLVGQDEVK